MNPGLVVKLRPAGPWRIGPDSGARNRVDVIYHSDSLYSAVTSAMARMGALDEWLDATARNQSPAVCFGSCFPFIEDAIFVVPPRTLWPPTSPALMSARVRWKSARFVPLTVVQTILSGAKINPNQWSVDGASGCLLPAGKTGPFRTGVRWSAAVDRLTGASERHATACIEFRPGAGLWTVVAFSSDGARDQWQDRIKAAFRLLADTGFGGERSRGWGRAAAPEFSEGSLPELIISFAPPGVEEPPEEQPVPQEEPPVDEPVPAPNPDEPEGAASSRSPIEGGNVDEPALSDAPLEAVLRAPDTMAALEVAAAEDAGGGGASGVHGSAGGAAHESAAPAPESDEANAESVEAARESATVALEAESVGAAPESDESASESAVAAASEPVQPAPESVEAAPEPAAAAPEPEPAPAVPPTPSGLEAHWLLSLFTPAAADTVDWGRGCYTVLARGGRVESPSGSGELKKQVQMVAEGSVLYAASAPAGAAADVAPDGFAHPVFRAGFALSIRLPEVH